MGRAAVAVLLTFATFSSGCATMGGPWLGASRRPIASPQYDPVGRWDVVMALRRGSVIRVATKDGALHTGRYVGSVVHGLSLETDIEVQIARADVLQVDLVRDLRYRSIKRSILGGAATGALAFGAYEVTLGLLFAGRAHLPALRTWAMGAAWGAGMGALGAATARPRTIYISPAP